MSICTIGAHPSSFNTQLMSWLFIQNSKIWSINKLKDGDEGEGGYRPAGGLSQPREDYLADHDHRQHHRRLQWINQRLVS